jgi:hypothetical protein
MHDGAIEASSARDVDPLRRVSRSSSPRGPLRSEGLCHDSPPRRILTYPPHLIDQSADELVARLDADTGGAAVRALPLCARYHSSSSASLMSVGMSASVARSEPARVRPPSENRDATPGVSDKRERQGTARVAMAGVVPSAYIGS